MMLGYERQDGRKGIRNYVRSPIWSNAPTTSRALIATPFEEGGVQLIGFPGCYPNDYAQR